MQKEKAKIVLKELKKRYPHAKTALKAKNPFQLLVSVILSAQCTDERVNKVTPELFKKYKNPHDFAKADRKDVENLIRSTGFFRNKAKNIIEMSKILVEKFKGKVPSSMEDLLTLKGVARKTANIVLYHGFGKNEGIAVDTHVFRVARRLGLSDKKDPKKVEIDLLKLFPKKYFGFVSDALILFGREVCNARKPKCEECVFKNICNEYNKRKN